MSSGSVRSVQPHYQPAISTFANTFQWKIEVNGSQDCLPLSALDLDVDADTKERIGTMWHSIWQSAHNFKSLCSESRKLEGKNAFLVISGLCDCYETQPTNQLLGFSVSANGKLVTQTPIFSHSYSYSYSVYFLCLQELSRKLNCIHFCFIGPRRARRSRSHSLIKLTFWPVVAWQSIGKFTVRASSQVRAKKEMKVTVLLQFSLLCPPFGYLAFSLFLVIQFLLLASVLSLCHCHCVRVFRPLRNKCPSKFSVLALRALHSSSHVSRHCVS